MPKGFAHFSATQKDLPAGPAGVTAGFSDTQLTKQEAAREFLNSLLDLNRLEGPQGLIDTSTDRPEFRLVNEHTLGVTDSTQVTFEQTSQSIPVFGSKVVVEVGAENEFVAASLNVADVQPVDYDAALDTTQAKQALATFLGVDSVAIEPSKVLLPNPDNDGKVVLTWRFQHVQFEPKADDNEVHDEGQRPMGCCGGGALVLEPDFDYFVDAQSGEVVFYFSNTAHVEIPTWCRGKDTDEVDQRFLGRVNGSDFAMENPFEAVRTTDLEFFSYDSGRIPKTITNPTNDWADSRRAAVSAHVNATRVVDFLYRVLRRKSIDDAGMLIENVTNVTENGLGGTASEWINAVWFRQKMWYGQRAQDGGFLSLARWLDVIAHELFHGITENTAKLVYRRLSGALNESISDIFGVIIHNWHLASEPADVSTWNWEIGSGLGSGGLPLRRMDAPSTVGRWRSLNAMGQQVIVNGYPVHMNQYVELPVTQAFDWGGVHWYSSIHNFAAYKVLTSQRADETFIFTPEEVAVLYYLTLTRLTELSEFSDVRRELLEVCTRVYAGDDARNDEAVDAVSTAYSDVGIV